MVAPAVPMSTWGKEGRYIYRYQIDNPNVGSLDWIVDPFAREFGRCASWPTGMPWDS